MKKLLILSSLIAGIFAVPCSASSDSDGAAVIKFKNVSEARKRISMCSYKAQGLEKDIQVCRETVERLQSGDYNANQVAEEVIRLSKNLWNSLSCEDIDRLLLPMSYKHPKAGLLTEGHDFCEQKLNEFYGIICSRNTSDANAFMSEAKWRDKEYIARKADYAVKYIKQYIGYLEQEVSVLYELNDAMERELEEVPAH